MAFVRNKAILLGKKPLNVKEGSQRKHIPLKLAQGDERDPFIFSSTISEDEGDTEKISIYSRF